MSFHGEQSGNILSVLSSSQFTQLSISTTMLCCIFNYCSDHQQNASVDRERKERKREIYRRTLELHKRLDLIAVKAESDPIKSKEIWYRQLPILRQLLDLDHYTNLIDKGEMRNIHNCPSLDLLLHKKD